MNLKDQILGYKSLRQKKMATEENNICRLFSLVHDVPLDFGFSGFPCLMIASWYLFIPFSGGIKRFP